MRKSIFKYVLLLFIISMCIGFLFAKEMQEREVAQNENKISENIFQNVKVEEIGENNKIDVLETSFEEDKIEVDTKLILKKNYIDCKHVISKEVELPGELINLTEEELKTNYPDWQVEEFDDDEVILSKKIYGLCSEHFVIESGKEFIEVYSLTEEYDKNLYEITNISIDYLAEEDLEKLKQGIYVYGLQELNSALESFE